MKRARGVHRPALARAGAGARGRPFLLLDCGANVEVRPEHLVQFAHMGAAFMQAVIGLERAARGAALERHRAEQGDRGRRGGARRARRRRGGLDFIGNVEGFAVGTRRGGRDRHRRLHRQRPAQGDGGNGGRRCFARSATPRRRVRAPRPAGCCCVRRCGGLRAAIDPEAQGGAFLLGLRRLAVVPHGSFGADGIARAIELAARGVRLDVVGATHERLAAAGALRRPSREASGPRGSSAAAATVRDP